MTRASSNKLRTLILRTVGSNFLVLDNRRRLFPLKKQVRAALRVCSVSFILLSRSMLPHIQQHQFILFTVTPVMARTELNRQHICIHSKVFRFSMAVFDRRSRAMTWLSVWHSMVIAMLA
jgi:hypothetical protein